MKNLAGHPEADQHCAKELTDAGIDVVFLDAVPRREVATVVTGRISSSHLTVTLTRAWYYWVADGLVPLAIAERLYADPIGKRDVRVAGHCGCPPPHEWTTDVDTDGVEICVDPDGSKERECADLAKRHPDWSFPATRFVRGLPSTARRFVASYHIDSAEGLKLFADAIKAGS